MAVCAMADCAATSAMAPSNARIIVSSSRDTKFKGSGPPPRSVAHDVGEDEAEADDAERELEDEHRLLVWLHLAVGRAGGLLGFHGIPFGYDSRPRDLLEPVRHQSGS